MLDTVYSPEVCEFSTSCRQRARLKIETLVWLRNVGTYTCHLFSLGLDSINCVHLFAGNVLCVKVEVLYVSESSLESTDLEATALCKVEWSLLHKHCQKSLLVAKYSVIVITSKVCGTSSFFLLSFFFLFFFSPLLKAKTVGSV